jgi:cell wall-associated NlpC family hydrolase
MNRNTFVTMSQQTSSFPTLPRRPSRSFTALALVALTIVIILLALIVMSVGSASAQSQTDSTPAPETQTRVTTRILITEALPVVVTNPAAESPVNPRAAQIASLTAIALSKLGSPYSYSAGGPNAFDCSGFTYWVFGQVGIDLPHNSVAQWNMVKRIPAAQAVAGDLVFNSTGSINNPGHVGIYLGNGLMIHSPSSGKYVRIDPITWWTGANINFGRVQ